MKGWLVNDTLTGIPGTKTFWHDLLEWIPSLEDKTGVYTPYNILADKIETEASNSPPDYIIRNGTFFRPLNINCKTISLIQDIFEGDSQQFEVANSSDIVVFNSPYTRSFYEDNISKPMVTIPLGVDFDFFKPLENKEELRKKLNILPNSILFVGAANEYPKGFDVVSSLIKTTSYNFCLVMKDDFHISHPRVTVFNKANHDKLVEIYNSCAMLICTSRQETLHLAGIEGAACGLPIVATNVGAYHNRKEGEWGCVSSYENFLESIEKITYNLNKYNPRKYFLEEGYDKKTCRKRWTNLI